MFQYTALSNGLSSAPRIFTKIAEVLFTELRKKGFINHSYLDDSLLIGDTLDECQNNVASMIDYSGNAGFVIHPEKSVI